MKGKRLVMLDLAALVAGASAQGQFEERLKGVLRDVENSNGQVRVATLRVPCAVGTRVASMWPAVLTPLPPLYDRCVSR